MKLHDAVLGKENRIKLHIKDNQYMVVPISDFLGSTTIDETLYTS